MTRGTVFAVFVCTLLSVDSQEITALDAVAIKSVSRRINTQNIFNLLARRPVTSTNDERSKEEEGTPPNQNILNPPFELPTLEERIKITEIELEEKNEEQSSTFQTIVEINNRAGIKGLTEGDIIPDRLRNAGGIPWPKTTSGMNRGLVCIPYNISNEYNAGQRQRILEAMAEFSKYTCVHFVPRLNESSFLSIENGDGCYSRTGRWPFGSQLVALATWGCLTKGIIMHELMHAVGFHHEHSRSDRDQYVRILWNNIHEGDRTAFGRRSSSRNLVIYDYGSIMHYNRFAFGSWSRPTIQIKSPLDPKPKIGQRINFSPYDIEEMKYNYQCQEGSYTRCGKDFIDRRNGVFKSPSYPKAYHGGAHCTWNISVARGKFVRVTFRNIDIKDSAACQEHAIHVHDGPNAGAPRLRSICGKQRQRVRVTATGYQMFIIFSSDYSTYFNRGFRAFFDEVGVAGPPKVFPTIPTLVPINETVRQLSCNFDTDMCGMLQGIFDYLNWIRRKERTGASISEPLGDHTTGKGHYMLVNSSASTERGDSAIIRTPWFQPELVFCVKYSNYMFGHLGVLRLFASEKKTGSNNTNENMLTGNYRNQGLSWKAQQITYAPKPDVQQVQFYWEAILGAWQTFIALDDIFITPGNCTMNSREEKTSNAILPASRIFCTFDNDLCGFKQSTEDTSEWLWYGGPTPAYPRTGPPSDRTTGRSGYYLYSQAFGRSPGDFSELLSPKLTMGKHCLSLWYYMHGFKLGNLTILQVVNGTSIKLTEIRGEKGPKWNELKVDLISSPAQKLSREKRNFETGRLNVVGNSTTLDEDPVSPSIQFVIKATRGGDFQGDIAIDDLQVSDSACEVPVRPAPPASQRPRLYAGMPLCTFESKQGTNNRQSARPGRRIDTGRYVYPRYATNSVLCGWRQSPRDQFDWTRFPGPTSSQNGRSQTTERGSYMYINASTRKSKDTASLLTYPMPPSEYCMDIHFRINGTSDGSLVVRATERLSNGRFVSYNLRSLEGNQENSWNNERIEYTPRFLNALHVSFQLQGKLGKDLLGEIAIDDIKILAGRCGDCIITTKEFVEQGNLQRFNTGCVHNQLFYVRCCFAEKAIYRQVTNCNADMFNPRTLSSLCTF